MLQATLTWCDLTPQSGTCGGLQTVQSCSWHQPMSQIAADTHYLRFQWLGCVYIVYQPGHQHAPRGLDHNPQCMLSQPQCWPAVLWLGHCHTVIHPAKPHPQSICFESAVQCAERTWHYFTVRSSLRGFLQGWDVGESLQGGTQVGKEPGISSGEKGNQLIEGVEVMSLWWWRACPQVITFVCRQAHLCV